MRIDVVTIFPSMFKSYLDESILKRAQAKGLLKVNIVDLRDYATGRHRQVDDAPYGGGAGMVMKPEPFFKAVFSLTRSKTVAQVKKKAQVILLDPQGEVLIQRKAKQLAGQKYLILLCPRYEGVDERVKEHLATESISIGDYVLTGGELPAMVLIDVVARHIKGVVGKAESVEEESFTQGLLEYPQYTRPADYLGLAVPQILLSGDHKQIAKWRQKEALEKTLHQRPDLLKSIRSKKPSK